MTIIKSMKGTCKQVSTVHCPKLEDMSHEISKFSTMCAPVSCDFDGNVIHFTYIKTMNYDERGREK